MVEANISSKHLLIEKTKLLNFEKKYIFYEIAIYAEIKKKLLKI